MKIKKSIFILMVIVLITILGTVLYKDEKYNLIIIASFALSCLPFYFKYENSKPKIREVVVLATMIALTVVSRTIFMLTPTHKTRCRTKNYPTNNNHCSYRFKTGC